MFYAKKQIFETSKEQNFCYSQHVRLEKKIFLKSIRKACVQRQSSIRGKRQKWRRFRSIRRFQDSRHRVESSRNAMGQTGDRYIVPYSSRPRSNHYHATTNPATATCRADASILPGPWQETRNQFYCISVLAHSCRVWMQICFIRVSGIRRGPNTFNHGDAREPTSDMVKHTN